MANTNAPLGFKPMRYLNGALWTGAVNKFRIASAYNTSIYQGDVVKLINTGYIQRAAAAEVMVGVFVGCYYRPASPGPMGQAVRTNIWAASTATFQSQDAVALVIDDPNVVFEAQMSAALSAVPAQIGECADILATAGSALTGMSAESLDQGSLAATLKQFRIIDYIDRPDNDTNQTAYTRMAVAPLNHLYRTQVGI